MCDAKWSHARSRQCVEMSNVCRTGEQIVFPSVPTEDWDRLLQLIKYTKDPSNAFYLMRPLARPSVIANVTPNANYTFMPLATGARQLRSQYARTNTIPASWVFEEDPAIFLFVSWSNSFTELFSRAVVALHALWCGIFRTRRVWVHPTMWGSDWSNNFTHLWLRPFTKHPVHPLATTPPADLVVPLWEGRATADQFAQYASYARYGRARCHKRALMCDFGAFSTAGMRPWSTFQHVASYHRAAPPRAACAHAFCIVFARRSGRRRLYNLDALLEECSSWRPTRVHCAAHDFGSGLADSLDVLHMSDVMVAPHGADLINAFGMREGSAVIEILPPYQHGCPCSMYEQMFRLENRVKYHAMQTRNTSRAVLRTRERPSYNADMIVPWDALRVALEHALEVNTTHHRPFVY